MRLPNSVNVILNNLSSRQKITLALLASLLAIIVVISMVTTLIKNPTKSSLGTTKTDKLSGEQVNTIPGQNESFGESEKRPYVLGLNSLHKLGVSVYQTGSLSGSLYLYSTENKLGIKSASIDVNKISIEAINERTPSQTTIIGAPFVIDDSKQIYMKISYITSEDVRIWFYESKDGKQIYDSGQLYSPDSINGIND